MRNVKSLVMWALRHFSMTVQDRAQERQAWVSSPFKWAANIFIVSFLRYTILTWFFQWKGIIKHQSSARSFHLLLMTLYLTTCRLNFYPPPQGLITKPTDSAEPNYSLLIITVSLTSTTCSIKHTAHVQIFLCMSLYWIWQTASRKISEIIGIWFPRGITLELFPCFFPCVY